MDSLYRQAIQKAGRVRKELGLSMFQIVNIFDACRSMGIDVRFVDINMEGFYVMNDELPTILISTQRPFPRRIFTCGHELGHHVFGHGTKLDLLNNDNKTSPCRDTNEILADAFAAALLMPVGGVQAQFAKRNWKFDRASPLEYYIICSHFGVGYTTLVNHCRTNDLITQAKANTLLKLTPAKIFSNHFGNLEFKSYYRILDSYTKFNLIDMEVNNYIVIVRDWFFEDDEAFIKISDVDGYQVYVVKKSGIFLAKCKNPDKNFFVRIQKENYVGLAEYRHLEI